MALTKISGGVIQSSVNVGIITASQVNVGSAVTIHSGGFVVGGSDLHSTGLTVENLNASGVVTATSFSGSDAVVAGVLTAISFSGSVTGNITGNVNSTGVSTFTTLRIGTAVTISSGVITATSFVGDGTNLTNTGSTLSAASGSQRVVLTSQTSGTMTASATSSSLSFNASTGALSATSFSGNLTGNVTGNSTGLSGTPNVSVGTISATSLNVSGVVTATSFSGSGSNLTNIGSASISSNAITTAKIADESITAAKFVSNTTDIDLNRKKIYLPRGFFSYGTDNSVPSGTTLNGFPYGEGYAGWSGYTTISGHAANGSTVTVRNINNQPNGLLIIEMTRADGAGGPYGNIGGGGHEIWSVNTAHHGWSGGSATLINSIGTLHGSYTTGSWYGIYITGSTGGTYYRVTFIN